jgi:hypothetical protein
LLLGHWEDFKQSKITFYSEQVYDNSSLHFEARHDYSYFCKKEIAMSDLIRARKDKEAIHRLLTENLQIKGAIPSSRRAFDDDWQALVKDYNSAGGAEFNKQVVKEYLEKQGCSNNTIADFLRTLFKA